jgi:hypothetical protein
MRTLVWPSLAAVAAGAASANGARMDNCTRHIALTSNLVSPPPSTGVGALPSSSTISNFTIHTDTQDEAPHALIRESQDAAPTTVATTEPTRTKAETQSHAEPDASLEIAFLVLGVLLALASVAVAVFFGYKQLSFMRIQSNTGSNDVHDNGNGVDIEMGPVTDDASDGVGAATDAADPNSLPSSA